MWTAHETKLRLGRFLLPDYRIVGVDAFEFFVVDHVNLRIGFDQRLTEFLRLWRELIDMIKPDRTVGSRCRAEILKIRARLIIKLRAEPLIETLHVWYGFHDFHAYR